MRPRQKNASADDAFALISDAAISNRAIACFPCFLNAGLVGPALERFRTVPGMLRLLPQ